MRPSFLVTVTLAMLAGAGCGTTFTKTIPTQRYYGYTAQQSSSLDHEPPPSPPEKATAAIQKGKRVAFVPPDTCLDMRAADTSTTVDKRVLRMQCGVTMSELEREAEKVGFDVVTWQSLKGASKPLDQAKEQKIDLLFEVNELDVIEESDRAESSEFRYFYGEGNGPVQPLKVTSADNQACKAYHAQNAPKVNGMTSVLDIKMVQVNTGSVLWSYRNVENSKTEDASSLIRFQVNARQDYTTRRPWWPWIVIAAGIGIAAGADPAVGAGIAAAGAVALLVIPKSTSAEGAPQYEPVSAVLCRRPHIVEQGPPVAKPRETTSDTFRSDEKIHNKDYAEEHRRELIKISVQVFMKQLTSGR